MRKATVLLLLSILISGCISAPAGEHAPAEQLVPAEGPVPPEQSAAPQQPSEGAGTGASAATAPENITQPTVKAIQVGCDYGYPPCPAGYLCSENRCLAGAAKRGCYDSAQECADTEFCISNTCIGKSELLPPAASSSPDCGYNEVYADGSCVEAAFTINFVSSGLTQEQFDGLAERTTALFIYHTPLRGCPEKLRVHKTFDACCNGTSCGGHFTAGAENATVYFSNASMPSCTISASGMVSVPLSDSYAPDSSALHEISHILGLMDQYCYWPFDGNPNPADYGAAGCRPLKEGEPLFDYCSDLARLPEGIEPALCTGNPNYFGGITVMGFLGDPSRDDPSHPLFGFTAAEYEYIAKKITCG